MSVLVNGIHLPVAVCRRDMMDVQLIIIPVSTILQVHLSFELLEKIEYKKETIPRPTINK